MWTPTGSCRALVAVVIVWAIPGTTSASAQSSPVPFPAGAPSSFEFSLSNPGARSLGLGGAFVALADDATAAFANPAGLVKLLRPEVSVEARHWAYSTPFVRNGRLSARPTGILLDDEAGLREGRSEEEVDSLSFVSLVYPRGRWSFAVYHHQQIDFSSRIETRGLFGDQASPPFAPRHVDMRSTTRDRIASDGLSIGLDLGKGWSVGLGLSHFDAELSTTSEFFWPRIPIPDAIYGEIPFSEEHRVLTLDIRSHDTDWGWIAGLLWRPTQELEVGAFYRKGPEVELGIEVRSGQNLPGPPPGTTLFEGTVSPMTFPDVYGLGVSYQLLSECLTLSFEWDRVTYSSVLEGFRRDLDSGGALDDGNELHFGAEYAWLRARPLVAVRAGAWLDPDHRIRSTQDPETGVELIEGLFRRGSDEWHVAFGVGVVFEHLQVDVAADLSERVDTVALSTIVTF